MISEERKRRIATEIDRLMQNTEDVALAQAFAGESERDQGDDLAKLERGEE